MVAELTALGFETLIARDGADGIAKAERGRPDLIPMSSVSPLRLQAQPHATSAIAGVRC
jgi:hypothetical protein